MRRRLLAIAFVPVLGLAACGDKQGTAPSAEGKVGHEAAPTLEPKREQSPARVIEHRVDIHDTPDREDPVATTGTTLPADFPITLPAHEQMKVVNRVVEPDGRKLFTADFEASRGDLEAVAAEFQATFEAKGLTVERTKHEGPDSAMITLTGKQHGGTLEGSATLSTSSASPNVVVVFAWSDKTGVAP